MESFRFLNWQVYQDSRELFGLVFKIVKKLPKENRFDLGGQIIRSASSIALNIAEGSGKSSDKDLNRFLNIASGSLNETLANADLLCANGLISEDDFSLVFKKIGIINNQIGGFKKKLIKKQ